MLCWPLRQEAQHMLRWAIPSSLVSAPFPPCPMSAYISASSTLTTRPLPSAIPLSTTPVLLCGGWCGGCEKCWMLSILEGGEGGFSHSAAAVRWAGAFSLRPARSQVQILSALKSFLFLPHGISCPADWQRRVTEYSAFLATDQHLNSSHMPSDSLPFASFWQIISYLPFGSWYAMLCPESSKLSLIYNSNKHASSFKKPGLIIKNLLFQL